jgi:hypothetical protein
MNTTTFLLRTSDSWYYHFTSFPSKRGSIGHLVWNHSTLSAATSQNKLCTKSYIAPNGTSPLVMESKPVKMELGAVRGACRTTLHSVGTKARFWALVIAEKEGGPKTAKRRRSLPPWSIDTNRTTRPTTAALDDSTRPEKSTPSCLPNQTYPCAIPSGSRCQTPNCSTEPSFLARRHSTRALEVTREKVQ